MPKLITDIAGVPSPQYLKRDGTAYEASRGEGGAFDANVVSMPALATGSNTIGKIQLDTANNIIRYLETCNVGSATTLWAPNTDKRIILKGIRIQNYTVETGSVASGLGDPDATVELHRGSVPIMQVQLEGKHIISDTSDKIFLVGGSYGVTEMLFGDGLKLPVDAVLNIVATKADVTVTAWGFEE